MMRSVDILSGLLKYCEGRDFKGYDPYDGLNSSLFRSTPLYRFKLMKQVWTQLFKFSPFNLRPATMVSPGHNPKGLALFVSGLINLFNRTRDERYLERAGYLLDLLKRYRTEVFKGYSWGYNFPWQSRSFFAPEGTPNAICTVFVVEAFLKAYKATGSKTYLDIVKQGLRFFTEGLNRSYKGDAFCFSYTPMDRSCIHNVNLLVSNMIGTVNIVTVSKELEKLCDNSVKYSLGKQNPDGSWYYGDADNQRWIDSFHTGYNLVALKRYMENTGKYEIKPALMRGYEFFRKYFFSKDGRPGYYHDEPFPIDIHSAAQALITFLEFKDADPVALSMAKKTLSWTLKNMYDKKGFFYFQKKRFYTIKIPYMRWAQAWMFYALSAYPGEWGTE